MALIRRRLLLWLIRAYIKKWGKFIIFSFAAGIIIFAFFTIFFKYVAHFFPEKSSIGLVGAYTTDSLPGQITSKLSRGLTKVESNGEVKPDLAESWEITNGNKTYTIHLKRNVFFSNGKQFTSGDVEYKFADAQITKPDKFTIIFNLKTKDPYAPFLVTLARPIFPENESGLGDYKIASSDINGDYISELTLINKKNKRDQITYLFYPTQDALKTAFLLGELTQVTGINNTVFRNMQLANPKATIVKKSINYSSLVTLFYNTKDKDMSDNKLRKALSYTLPDSFDEGERAYVPYSPHSIYFNSSLEQKKQDLAHAKLLLDSAFPDNAKKPTLEIKTLSKYHDVAQNIAVVWKQLGFQVKIEDVEVTPDIFQIYLGDFIVPRDPDQYALWHSSQEKNITRFQNLRIDKLLEDGRKTTSVSERKTIYADFQKYLNDDANGDTPASFLYFPYSYTITRKE